MRKLIKATYAGHDRSIGWVSFQPDGSISFGLNDRTYVSPRHCIRSYFWNAYNRVTIQYTIPSDPDALLPVRNPHFTYHPIAMFHLKADVDRKAKNQEIFDALADLGIILQQQEEMPWIRATSAPLSTLKTAGIPRDGITSQDLTYVAPAILPSASAYIEIDFLRPESVHAEQPATNVWQYIWGDAGLRIRVGAKPAQISTLLVSFGVSFVTMSYCASCPPSRLTYMLFTLAAN